MVSDVVHRCIFIMKHVSAKTLHDLQVVILTDYNLNSQEWSVWNGAIDYSLHTRGHKRLNAFDECLEVCPINTLKYTTL